ncbi:GWT1-domain-containing protein [Mycena olivaceomarginata]|nr:GWT1-domain-containing protein [Mycena olivaceomarginata]
MSDYKTFKEASVTGLTGSTRHPRQHDLFRGLVLGLLAFILLLPTALILLRTTAPDNVNMPQPASGRSPAPPHSTPSYAQLRFAAEVRPPSLTPLPAITTYRAHMMLMTVLGILAVDFRSFRSYGVSLVLTIFQMDLGVGSFVFSSGVVSAIPLLKDPAHLKTPLLPKVTVVVRKTLPIIAIGVIRVCWSKAQTIPCEHETEYGVHWNFFISLALLPVLQTLLHPLLRVAPASLFGVGVGILQQLFLSVFGLKEYVRSAPRLNLISANKEGIVSLAGYLSIHLLGLSIGTLILPPSPNFFRRLLTGRSTPAELGASRQNDKGAIELASYAIVWWALLAVVSLLRVDEGVSRQTANLPYALWIAAFNTSYILGYLVLDMLFFPTPAVRRKKSRQSTDDMSASASPVRAPPLLEAINKNALPVFLLANVLTGLVNLSMQTMYASAGVSMSVLSLYAFVVSGVAWRLKGVRVWRL